jgi:hypothetical protein
VGRAGMVESGVPTWPVSTTPIPSTIRFLTPPPPQPPPPPFNQVGPGLGAPFLGTQHHQFQHQNFQQQGQIRRSCQNVQQGPRPRNAPAQPRQRQMEDKPKVAGKGDEVGEDLIARNDKQARVTCFNYA